MCVPARSVTWVAKEASQGGGPSGHEGWEVAIQIAKERVLPSGRSMPARPSFHQSIPVSLRPSLQADISDSLGS